MQLHLEPHGMFYVFGTSILSTHFYLLILFTDRFFLRIFTITTMGRDMSSNGGPVSFFVRIRSKDGVVLRVD